jgi:hypothetical protein
VPLPERDPAALRAAVARLDIAALAARLRDCERIVAESADRNARRAAAAEISEILRRAESATT